MDLPIIFGLLIIFGSMCDNDVGSGTMTIILQYLLTIDMTPNNAISVVVALFL